MPLPPRGCISILWLCQLCQLCAYAAATTASPSSGSGNATSDGSATSFLSSHTTTTPTSTSTTSAAAITPSPRYQDPLVFLPKEASLCPARTVNYITHTLPQQCLRSSRTALAGVGSANGTLAGAEGVNGTVVEKEQEIRDGKDEKASTDMIVDQKAEEKSEEKVGEAGSVGELLKETQTESASTPTLDLDHDSPLDTSKFLSFEEWKLQNLAKVGQSPENVGQGRPQNTEGRRRPINNALDTLGEEGEIELDFTGFGQGAGEGGSRYTPSADTATKASDAPASDQIAPGSVRHRSKDAGTTCKERFNYASFDCAATVLKTNPQCKSSTSILVENKDSYMLNECSASNKFLILELCDDILVDTIVVANFEFFSSMFRTFRISVSDRYPVKLDRWKTLGTFEARNSREIQAFLVENPLIWARYLRVEFLTHYGSEFYCPVSLLRVHGTTMMEEFRSQDDSVRGDEEGEDEGEGEGVEQPVVVEITSEHVPEPEPTVLEKVVEDTIETAVLETSTTELSVEVASANKTMVPVDMPTMASNATMEDAHSTTTAACESKIRVPAETPPQSSAVESSIKKDTAVSEGPPPKPTKAISEPIKPTANHSSSNITENTSSVANSAVTASTGSNSTSIITDTQSTNTTQTATTKTDKPAAPKADNKTTKPSTETVNKPAASTAQPSPPQPSTQESFFKSTNKRLGMLETNSSLNIQYIEEQSRILRDAFIQTEKHQLRKTEKFLEHLNESVIAELKGFRQDYDQLWQSTVIELETHREKYQREMGMIGERLTLMADELVFQKRMIVVQSVLLLLSLGLVLFARSGKDYMELPLMQQVVTKSQSYLRRGHHLESPPGSPEMTSGRESSPEFRKGLRGLKRLATPGSEVRPGSRESDVSPTYERGVTPSSNGNPGLRFEPPTPEASLNGRSLYKRSRSPTLSPDEVDAARFRETRSGPATPSGSRENEPLDWDSSAGDSPVSTREGGSSPVTERSPPLGKKKTVERRPSPLRFSESEAEGVEDEVECGVMQSIEEESYTAPTATARKHASEGSSDDGDTAGDIMTFDMFD